MKKRIIITSMILISVALMSLGLNFSDKFNDLIFSNIINPYNALKINSSPAKSPQIDSLDYWKDPRDIFPIFAYNVPESTKDIAASLKIMEKGGINILVNGGQSWMPAPYKINDAFKKLGKTDLRWMAILVNKCRNDFIFKNSDDATNAHIKKYLKEFNSDFVYGWYLWDEPGSNRKSCTPFNLAPNDDNADINRMASQIRSDSVFSKKLGLVNLFPTYWKGTPDFASYKKYIDAYISSQSYKPRLLCFDNYPLIKNELGGFRRDYYANLSIISKKSVEYNIPFWSIVVSSEHLEYKKPSIEDISLQVYSALAYGAKGIGYFIYSKSWTKVGYKSWILENFVDDNTVPDSLHGPLYLPVKNLNLQVQALGKVLSELEPLEVVHSSDYPNKQRGIADEIFEANTKDFYIKDIVDKSNASAKSKILIGILKSRISKMDSSIYLLAVNKDVSTKADVLVLINSVHNIFSINKNNGQKSYIGQSDSLEVSISPGSGELFYCRFP